MDQPTCATCRHWNQPGYLEDRIGVGLCTLAPPDPAWVAATGNLWPLTEEDDHCGHHETAQVPDSTEVLIERLARVSQGIDIATLIDRANRREDLTQAEWVRIAVVAAGVKWCPLDSACCEASGHIPPCKDRDGNPLQPPMP